MKLYVGNGYHRLEGCVVALGTFDGCHNGHRRVLRRAAAIAGRRGVPFAVWTYREHPLALIAPEKAPKSLQSVEQRLASFQEMGADAVFLRSFTRAEADTEPEAFARHLAEDVGAGGVVVGRTNTFGKGAKGTPVFLEKQGERLGFTVDIVDTVRIGSRKVTSSAIRARLEAGDMRAAAAMLGRDYSLEGEIIRGKQFGRTMGFPTINVRLPEGRQLPRYGVYAGWAEVAGESRPCVMNIGVRPTVDGKRPTLEAYLLDYRGNLYDQSAVVRIHQFIRPEKKFASTEALQNAIAAAVREARRILS